MDAARRGVSLNPYDMGARGVLGVCHLVSGEHREAIETVHDGSPASPTTTRAINGRP